MTPDLFTPLNIGPYVARNRVLMAPCTRCRADEHQAPTDLNARYYAQRAGAGLIISEAAQISEEAVGYPRTPGIHTAKQVAGWRRVTDAVHREGGLIFCQLWHVGRVSHTSYQPEGRLPVSSSPLAKSSPQRLQDGSTAPCPIPRALETGEIARVMRDYQHAARCAQDAGFDGVEFHGANGYLAEQFLRSGANTRTDRYGGVIENRARFHLEAAAAIAEVWGPSRVGVRLSPSNASPDLRDENPRETFAYVVCALGRMGLAYLHIMEAMDGDLNAGASIPGWDPIPVSFFRPMFDGVLITNARFTKSKADSYLAQGFADAVAFGTAFIANPDLPERFRRDAPLNTPDPTTYYTPGERGYTDYPFLNAERS